MAVLVLSLLSGMTSATPEPPEWAVILGSVDRATNLRLGRTGRAAGKLLPQDVRNVALADVISPRIVQKRGGAAARFLHDLSVGELVYVEPTKPAATKVPAAQSEDQDEPAPVARVRQGKVWIHEALVQAGWAWVVPSARADAALIRLEKEARDARRGLWADADPMPPWEWRELVLLRDEKNRHVHAGWACPWVQQTQCQGCAGRFYNLAESRAAGFTPHQECMHALELRIAENGEDLTTVRSDGPPALPPSPRRACVKDADCAFVPELPCTCSPCGNFWQTSARREVVQRMEANFRRVSCMGQGCPECAQIPRAKQAVCRANQCTVL